MQQENTMPELQPNQIVEQTTSSIATHQLTITSSLVWLKTENYFPKTTQSSI